MRVCCLTIYAAIRPARCFLPRQPLARAVFVTSTSNLTIIGSVCLHSAVSTSTPSRHQACDAIYRSAYIRFGGSRRMTSFFGARALSESLLRGLRNSSYAGPDHPAGAQQQVLVHLASGLGNIIFATPLL